MKKLLLILGIALIAGCNANRKVESTSEIEFPGKGSINWEDTISLSKIPDSKISDLDDKSIVYLRQDNYCPDQFYCVAKPYCYYRLTNTHPKNTISGNVHKRWMYDGQERSEDTPFTLKPQQWQTFGCYYVSITQPITFSITSHFDFTITRSGTENDMLQKEILDAEELFHTIDYNGVGSINTVSKGPDNGANNTQACTWNSCMRHITTAECINNILDRFNSSPSASGVNIGGHGNLGLLTTGMGQNGNWENSKFLYSWNQYYWEPIFNKLKEKNFPELVIWSCETGAGEEGAEFLYRLAKVINKPVRAGTGLLIATSWSDGRCKIAYEAGSQYQIAYPDKKPSPIEPPQHLSLFQQKRDYLIIIDENKTRKRMVVSDIIDFKVDFFSSKDFTRKSSNISGQKIMDSKIESIFSIPFIMENTHVLGIVTKTITIKFADSQKTLSVYNDKLVKDNTSDYFYFINPDFIYFLESLK